MSSNTLSVRLTIRTDTQENWVATNPVLLKGEMAFESDTYHVKIGDGVSTYNTLNYLGTIASELAYYFMAIGDYKGTAVGVVKSADKLETARNINGVAFDGTKDITIQDSTKVPLTYMGKANGVATLDKDGLVPSSQLPSYVDDVIEGYFYNNKFYKDTSHTTEISGESGKIYVDLNDSKYSTYRFSGTAFISISNPLDIASEAEAKSGADNTKAMTPLRVEQAIINHGYITEVSAAEIYEPVFTKNTAFNKNFGSSAGTVTEGNDSRLSDSRTPKGNAGGDLTGSYPNPTIGASKVTTAKIADSNVTTAKLASSSVTTEKIADASVTTLKLVDSSVTTAKINVGAVTTEKIADSNVTSVKLASNSVTTVKISDKNVTNAKIADSAITDSKIADNSLSTSKLFVPSNDTLILDGGNA